MLDRAPQNVPAAIEANYALSSQNLIPIERSCSAKGLPLLVIMHLKIASASAVY